jgi:hypothetical protein
MVAISALLVRLGLPQTRIVWVLLASAILGVACHVASSVWRYLGVQAIGMTTNSVLLEENGRYFEATRDREPRVIQEISVEQFDRRTAYTRTSVQLLAAGNFLMAIPVLTLLAFKGGILFKR